MLKLVPKHSYTAEISDNKNNKIMDYLFSDKILVKGPFLYSMTLQDPAHGLASELIIETEENRQYGEKGTVACHFPPIADEKLNDFIAEDETLYGIIMIQFQMKILEQLFSFCIAHGASKLAIFADDAQADALGIYDDFLAYKDQTLTHKGEKTEMIIPMDQKTFDAWRDFMKKMTAEFRQTLWRDQGSNPIIRQYLKSRPLG